jgi:non-homologous end joining protein Ku
MDQQIVDRASARTTLVLGEVEAPIGLFKVSRDPARARVWQKPPVEKEGDEGKSLGDALTGSTKGKKGRLGTGAVSSKKLAPPADEPPEKPRKGIVKPDGNFVDLTDQIEQIVERTTLDRLEVVSFIRREQVPRERILNAYYVGTGTRKKGSAGHSPSQVLALLYRGLKLRGRAAVVRWGMRTKSAVGVMIAHGSGSLVVLELAYSENVLAPNPECLAHQHVALDDSRVEQMAVLIDAMAESRASLDDIRDHRAMLEAELVIRAEHGEAEDFTAERYEADEKVADLSELLDETLTAAAA